MKWDKFPGAATAPAKQKKTTQPEVQELGWIFEMPAAVDHFSWHRRGYFSYYPADHIGRISGTATPDSADQEITRITRPDAFDFNSTKYHCDWAMLADSSGRGIAIKSTGDEDRQNCRAGTGSDGRRQLVVNKVCCPPRDISSNVVPDFYVKDKSVSASFMVGAATGRP
jgi:hypothetical protein